MDYDKALASLEKMQEANKKMFFGWLKILKKILITTVWYSIIAFIFLGIYQQAGFETTLIILLIGIFYINWSKGLSA